MVRRKENPGSQRLKQLHEHLRALVSEVKVHPERGLPDRTAPTASQLSKHMREALDSAGISIPTDSK